MATEEESVQRRIEAFAELARTSVSDGGFSRSRDLLARAGVEAGVAIAAAVLIDELVSLDDRTQELLSGDPPLSEPGAVELALVTAGHQSTYAALATVVASVAVALPDERLDGAVVERMATDARGLHEAYLGDCPPLRWPCRLASHAADLVMRSLRPDAVPDGRARIDVIRHFLVVEMGGLLLACAALTPSDAESDELGELDEVFDKDMAAEPLPLMWGPPASADLGSPYRGAVREVVASLEITPISVDGGTQPHTLVPLITAPLGRLGAAVASEDAPLVGALREVAESAACAAAGVEMHLSDRPPSEAVAAVRAVVYERAAVLPRVVRGAIMRHASLATLTGAVSRGAQVLTFQLLRDSDEGTIEAWQSLRDDLLQLAGVAVSDIADPPDRR